MQMEIVCFHSTSLFEHELSWFPVCIALFSFKTERLVCRQVGIFHTNQVQLRKSDSD